MGAGPWRGLGCWPVPGEHLCTPCSFTVTHSPAAHGCGSGAPRPQGTDREERDVPELLRQGGLPGGGVLSWAWKAEGRAKAGTRGSMRARGRRGPQRGEGREARLSLRMGPGHRCRPLHGPWSAFRTEGTARGLLVIPCGPDTAGHRVTGESLVARDGAGTSTGPSCWGPLGPPRGWSGAGSARPALRVKWACGLPRPRFPLLSRGHPDVRAAPSPPEAGRDRQVASSPALGSRSLPSPLPFLPREAPQDTA